MVITLRPLTTLRSVNAHIPDETDFCAQPPGEGGWAQPESADEILRAKPSHLFTLLDIHRRNLTIRRHRLVIPVLASWLMALFGGPSVRKNRDREAMSADGQVPSMNVEEGDQVRGLGSHNLVSALRLCPPAFPRRLRAKVYFIRTVRMP